MAHVVDEDFWKNTGTKTNFKKVMIGNFGADLQETIKGFVDGTSLGDKEKEKFVN